MTVMHMKIQVHLFTSRDFGQDLIGRHLFNQQKTFFLYRVVWRKLHDLFLNP